MEDLRETICALHESGVPRRQIAHQLGVAHATVSYHLNRAAEAPPDAQRGPRHTRPTRSTTIPTRTLVAQLLALGLCRSDIARRLGIAKSTVSYHARALGEDVDDRCARRFDWALIQRFYDEGHGVRECCRVFGFSTAAWNPAVQRGAIVPRPGFRPLEEIFAAGTRRQRGHLKQRLLTAGLKQERCELCGIEEWRGRPLSLALHHVNGLRDDNRVENLQLLCPNCHSQTDNFAGRRRRTESAPHDETGDGGG